MRKISKKTTTTAASSASSTDEDNSENDTTEKKVSNGAGKKDGANDSEDKKKQKNDDKKSKSNSRNKKNLNDQNDDKNKRKRPSKDGSEQSTDSDSSEDEALSKIAKQPKKSDTSSGGKANKKDKKQLTEPVQADAAQGDDDVEYEVEEVVSHKKSHGKMLYLIRWKGWGSEDDTWENASTLDNCPDILKKYTDEHPDSILTSANKTSKGSGKEKKLKKLEEIIAEEFDENADYEVEKIIDVFFKKDKSREFWSDGKDTVPDYDSWEPEEHLNCPDLIDKFMAKVEHAKNLSERN